MKSEIRHLVHYASLIGIICVSLWGLVVFSYDKTFQKEIIFSLVVAYISWGIIHHHIHEDLHLKVIIEYIAIGILGAVVLLSVIG